MNLEVPNKLNWVNFCSLFYFRYIMIKGPSIARLCLVSVVVSITLFEGIVCPFPPEDPRSILNPLIVPWWPYAPRGFRAVVHRAVTGEPLPPNDLENLPPVCPRCPKVRPLRLRRPRPFRPRRPAVPRIEQRRPLNRPHRNVRPPFRSRPV